MAFTDLRELRRLMTDQQIAVYSIRFHYNQVHCFMAICLLTEEERSKAQYQFALVRIRIMKQNNLLDYIDCPANTNGLDIRQGALRQFFNIQYDPNGTGQWLPDLTTHIGVAIQPVIFPEDAQQRYASIHTVCQHEGRDPNRIFPHHLLRHLPDENGHCHHRTEYNSQLARLQFPTVFPIYENETTVSFAFTDNEDDSVDERVAYARFIDNEKRRVK